MPAWKEAGASTRANWRCAEINSSWRELEAEEEEDDDEDDEDEKDDKDEENPDKKDW